MYITKVGIFVALGLKGWIVAGIKCIMYPEFFKVTILDILILGLPNIELLHGISSYHRPLDSLYDNHDHNGTHFFSC